MGIFLLQCWPLPYSIVSISYKGDLTIMWIYGKYLGLLVECLGTEFKFVDSSPKDVAWKLRFLGFRLLLMLQGGALV